jgi:hypothetical protein
LRFTAAERARKTRDLRDAGKSAETRRKTNRRAADANKRRVGLVLLGKEERTKAAHDRAGYPEGQKLETPSPRESQDVCGADGIRAIDIGRRCAL